MYGIKCITLFSKKVFTKMKNQMQSKYTVQRYLIDMFRQHMSSLGDFVLLYRVPE